MSDIFISYSHEDLEQIRPLIRALQYTGWSIFWDRTIPAGRTWRQVIGAEINNCRCMLVVWSERSIISDWVEEEADEGKRRGVLVPVLIDNILPPIGFRAIQAVKLDKWDGDTESEAFNKLITDLSSLLGKPPADIESKQESTIEARVRTENTKRKKELDNLQQEEVEIKRKAVLDVNEHEQLVTDHKQEAERGFSAAVNIEEKAIDEQNGKTENKSHERSNIKYLFSNRKKLIGAAIVLIVIVIVSSVAYYKYDKYQASLSGSYVRQANDAANHGRLEEALEYIKKAKAINYKADYWDILHIEEQIGAIYENRAKTKLTKDQLMAKGETAYAYNCAACHQPNGEGMGPFPALKDSKIVKGPLEDHINIVIKGKPGTAMAPFGTMLNDTDIAAVITYERNSFGNNMGDSVQPLDIFNYRLHQ